jgi:hypothetical protein
VPIHLGRHPSREGWLSFETDAYLTRTKNRLYERCLPCLTGVYEQLKSGALEIELTHAWTCWKVTAVVADDAECVRVLECFGEAFPEEGVHGKVGGGVGRPTSAVIFHTETEERRDELLSLLTSVLSERFPERTAVISRGCGIPYEQLLGPWREWKQVSPILRPDRVDEILSALRDSLYRR